MTKKISFGNSEITKVFLGNNEVSKLFLGSLEIYNASRLPSAFQEVEYIESSGTQTIITNLGINDFDCVETTYSYTQVEGNITNLCGLRNGNNIALSWIRNNGENQMEPYYGARFITNIKTIQGVKYNIKSYGVSGNQAVYQDGVLKASEQIVFDTTGTIKCSIFGLNNSSNSPQFIPKARIYKDFIFYLNNVIVGYFIPCYRKADNVAGLYDLVNNVFYTNAGTGTFIVGGNV